MKGAFLPSLWAWGTQLVLLKLLYNRPSSLFFLYFPQSTIVEDVCFLARYSQCRLKKPY